MERFVLIDVVSCHCPSLVSAAGRNKDNMPCCVITGRLLDPVNRQGTPLSFRRYILRTMEDKLKELTISEGQSRGATEAGVDDDSSEVKRRNRQKVGAIADRW